MNNEYKIIVGSACANLVGAAIKYTSLIGGVYFVCKDERDFHAATIAGLAYLVGEAFQKFSEALEKVGEAKNKLGISHLKKTSIGSRGD